MPPPSRTVEVTRFSWRHLAFIVPLALLHAGCALVFVVGASPAALAAFAITAALQVFGITVGYHRLLSHRAFRTGRRFQFVLASLGVLAGQNGPLWWVGHHRHHHKFADTADDTHSPRRSFFWSHAGWLFSPRCIPVREALVRDLARLPEMRFLENHYYIVVLGYALLLYIVGESLRDHGTSGAQLVVWGSVVGTVFAYHAIWSANSFCHRFGTRRFPTKDDSRNNFLVALVTFGDGWHHNHHYCPYSARHGFRWWEIDINYGVLLLLARLRLVWDLKLPPARIASTMATNAISRAHQR
jgi:stearoyl-CoA desaturase (delta-9 desaturase)